MATVQAILEAMRRVGAVSLPLSDFAALALAVAGRPLLVGELGPALSGIGLKTGTFAGCRPSDFAEPGRIKAFRGRIEPLNGVDVPTLLAPILTRLPVAPEAPTLPRQRRSRRRRPPRRWRPRPSSLTGSRYRARGPALPPRLPRSLQRPFAGW